eukprot:5350554-Prymnesium_polylepis.1
MAERGCSARPAQRGCGAAQGALTAHSPPTVQITADRTWDNRRHTSTAHRTHSVRRHGTWPQTAQHLA